MTEEEDREAQEKMDFDIAVAENWIENNEDGPIQISSMSSTNYSNKFNNTREGYRANFSDRGNNRYGQEGNRPFGPSQKGHFQLKGVAEHTTCMCCGGDHSYIVCNLRQDGPEQQPDAPNRVQKYKLDPRKVAALLGN